MEGVSTCVAAEVTRRKALATSRVSASSRRRLPGKGKFRNHLEPHHSDPMILTMELLRLVSTLVPPIRKIRRPKSEGRKKSEVRWPNDYRWLDIVRLLSRSRELIRSSEFGLLLGFGDSDFGFIGRRMGRGWNASLPGAPASRRLGENGQATCRRDDGAPRCGSLGPSPHRKKSFKIQVGSFKLSVADGGQ